MIKQGVLVQYKTDVSVLAEVIMAYDKMDVDPDCNESVAIIGMVKIIYLTGPEQGKKRSLKRRNFTHFWKVINNDS
jgi:hypothetical protein